MSAVKNSWLTPGHDEDRRPCNVLVGRTEGAHVVIAVTSHDGKACMPVDEAIKLRTRLGYAIEAAALDRVDVEWPDGDQP